MSYNVASKHLVDSAEQKRLRHGRARFGDAASPLSACGRQQLDHLPACGGKSQYANENRMVLTGHGGGSA